MHVATYFVMTQCLEVDQEYTDLASKLRAEARQPVKSREMGTIINRKIRFFLLPDLFEL